MSASRSLGVVMDPIAGIKPYKDSSFAMLLAAQARGYECHVLEQRDLWLEAGTAWGRPQRVTVRDDTVDWYALEDADPRPLGELDVILMRKDPPFDMEYIYTTYILDRAEAAGALVVNKPQSLRDMNEKAYIASFPDCAPSTLVTRSMDAMRGFLREEGKIVVKPLDGMGGRSIFTVTRGEPNANVIFETLTRDGTRYAMAQTFIPEIREGDKRIILVDGEPIPHALARVPSAEDGRGNLVMGAKGEGRGLTGRDREICAAVGPVMRERGVLFAGIDVIGDWLTEVNVTSPTGIRELDRLFDLDIAAALFEAIEARL